MSIEQNRSLTDDEFYLLRWMLVHGEPEAKNFLTQLEQVEVTHRGANVAVPVLIWQSKIIQHLL